MVAVFVCVLVPPGLVSFVVVVVSVLVLFLVVLVVVVVVGLLMVVVLFLLFHSCCFGCCYFLAPEHPKERKTQNKLKNPCYKTRRASVSVLCLPSSSFCLSSSFFLLLLLHLLVRSAVSAPASCASASDTQPLRPPRKRNWQKGDHLEEPKNPLSGGESAAPDAVFLSKPTGPPGRANPKQAENATSFCGCVIDPPPKMAKLFFALFGVFFAFRTTFLQVS